MKSEPFTSRDIHVFLELARLEQWFAEKWEIEFLLSRFPQGCFVYRDEAGKAAGFVTSLQHGKSSWIGNLIVAPLCRGKGIGGRLFQSALNSLNAVGVQTVWLTASKSGQPLYEKHGFTAIDTIVRRVGSGCQQESNESACGDKMSLARAYAIDRFTWGDLRKTLITATSRRGKLFQERSGFLVIQPCLSQRQIGPFSARNSVTAEKLFERALASLPSEINICLDTPASNRNATSILEISGMRETGTNVLMYAGNRPEYRAEYLYGLATMGSCG